MVKKTRRLLRRGGRKKTRTKRGGDCASDLKDAEEMWQEEKTANRRATC